MYTRRLPFDVSYKMFIEGLESGLSGVGMKNPVLQPIQPKDDDKWSGLLKCVRFANNPRFADTKSTASCCKDLGAKKRELQNLNIRDRIRFRVSNHRGQSLRRLKTLNEKSCKFGRKLPTLVNLGLSDCTLRL